MKVAEKKHFYNSMGRYINNPDKVMAEVNILRDLKHVSCKNMVGDILCFHIILVLILIRTLFAALHH